MLEDSGGSTSVWLVTEIYMVLWICVSHYIQENVQLRH